ncbi:hypothetical protein HDG37_005490 [Paraburkholderia sp. MM5384-R2]|nr:hypothetical protein [Paraburkholderia sp. MM5384-R2]
MARWLPEHPPETVTQFMSPPAAGRDERNGKRAVLSGCHPAGLAHSNPQPVRDRCQRVAGPRFAVGTIYAS